MLPELTPKQGKFVREYVKQGNGTQAAIDAGYSERSAHAIASENLTKPAVSEAVRILRQRLQEKLDVSREKLINDTAHIAEQAAANQEYGAAINANTLIMKAQGYLVERSMNVSLDVTQQHLEALQSYTDKRIDEGINQVRAEMQQGQRESATFTDLEPTQHNVSDISTDVMTNAAHVDATDNAAHAKSLTSLDNQADSTGSEEPPRDG